MPSNRDDIIREYRHRIAQNMRSRLSKSERFALAESFVDLLGYCQSEDDCKVLCAAEIALLEEGYSQNSIANYYLPEWRKAIAAAVEDGRLPKQTLEPNEFGNVYDHWALKHLLYPNHVYQELKQKTTAANNQKQDDLQPVRADRFIATARKLLAGDSPQEWVAGLLALTGRRFSEIVTIGEFWLARHPYAIAFKGQLKKGMGDSHDVEPFLIATLIDNKEIIKALERLRTHPRILELQGLAPDMINSKLNTSVRHHIKQAFQDTGLVPVLPGEKSVSAHNLRGVYGTIAIRFFCPISQTPHRFVQAHLGHIIGEQELATRKNAGATEHYFHYYLTEAQGQTLGDRGILLDKFGPLPTSVPLPPSAPLPPSVPLPTIGAYTHDFDEATISETSISEPSDYKTSDYKISNYKMPNYKTSDDEMTRSLEPIHSLGATLHWFTTEIDKLREDIKDLQRKVRVVQTERDQALEQLETNQELDSDERQELESLKEENKTLRGELQQFHQLKQLLGGGNEMAPMPVISPDRAPNIDSSSPNTGSNPKPSQKRIQDKERALEWIDNAISLIMDWNDNDDRTFDEKWYISVPVLQDLLRGSGYSAAQPKLKTAMDARRNEIDAHHIKHGLGRRHNVRHHQTISTLITLA